MAIVEHLVADTFGTHIGKYSNRLKVTKKGKTLQQAPLLFLETVSILGRGVSISADAIQACTQRGIPIHFVDGRGYCYASLYAAGLGGTILTRREQLRSYDDLRGFSLGIAFAVGKVVNQSATIRYWAKSRKDTSMGHELMLLSGDVLDYEASLLQIDAQPIDNVRHSIMALEGNAARLYWEAARLILPETYGWTKRIGRGATDPINCLLNYGYGILYSQIEQAIVLAGLDPYAGYIHADRPGKPSLVLDLIEEFRQVIVDRTVFGLAARSFQVEFTEDNLLSEETRSRFAEHILKRLEAKAVYNGKRIPLQHVIQKQARRIAAYLRKEYTSYQPYRAEI